MEKKLFLLSLLSCALFLISACSKDEQPNPGPDPGVLSSTGVYILNAGFMGFNDATLDYYDTETKELQKDIFMLKNGRGLGDTGQSLLIYGTKIYIAVSGSRKIEITDLSGKSLKQLEIKDSNGAPQSPYYFAYYKDKVYVTLYDGYVACIDTATMTVDEKQVKVGDNPEHLVVANNKIYVANSGGMNYPNYGKTVSIIDPVSFTVMKTLEVGENPQYMATSNAGNKVFLISTGDYSPGSNILQRIDTQTDQVTKIEGLNTTWMSMGADDKLYIINAGYDEQWNPLPVQYCIYDAANEKLLGEFISDGTTIPSPYHISTDKTGGNIYIGSSVGTNRGDMYIYSPEGKFLHKFELSGSLPEAVYFIP